MKVYIGNRNIQDENFKCITDLDILKYIADDSECTAIVIDGCLKNLKLSELQSGLETAIKKLRINGDLVINDIDFDLLLYAYAKNSDLVELNTMVENIGGFKSLLTYQFILEILKLYPNISLSTIDLNNIEFRLSYKKLS